MVLTDRQRADLHAGIHEYLRSRPGEVFQTAAQAMEAADPEAIKKKNGTESSSASVSNSTTTNSTASTNKTPLLEKKWTAIPRLQKKVLELERLAAQNAKIHAHRGGAGGALSATTPGGGTRRMLPRLPAQHTLQGHSSVVTSVAVHPVFTVAVSGSEDGTIKLWDHESGDYMRTLKGHTNTVNSVTFSPTGSHLASCSTDLSIKLWDFKTYACLRTLRGHDHTISAVRFWPKPGLLDMSTNDTATTGTVGGTRTGTSTGMDAATAGCAHLLSASRDCTVKLWDVETGFCDQTFSDHTDWVRCLAVRQSDGGLWASAGNDTTIQVYDTSKTKVMELRGHEHVVETLAFVTEEPLKMGQRETQHTQTIRDYLASGSRDRTVRLWKVSESSCIAVLNAHENWVRSVVIHPSGLYIISSSDDKSIRVFDIKAQRCLRTLDKAHNHFVTSLDMHYTLPVLVSGSVDQTVRCWQLD